MRKLVTLMLVAGFVCLLAPAKAQDKKKTTRRAAPPTFSDSDSGIFFNDVFSEGLGPQRPANLGVAKSTTTGGGTGGSGGGSDEPPPTGKGLYAWKDIISATTLEDEVKAIKLEVTKNVTTPNKFASSGYKRARKHFSILAVVFAIIAEYDGDVRWKADAAELRDAFSRTAGNSKVGTIQVFNEAKLRKTELEDLIGGASLTFAKRAESKKADWYEVADRAPLMQRIETAHQAKMQPWTAAEADFKANKDALVHEANIVAAIGEILIQEEMEDGAEEDYAVHSIQMRDAALNIVDAVKLDSYEQARKAVGVIGQSCANCHSDWR